MNNMEKTTMPGYEFLTNFESHHDNIYHRVAKAFGLDYAITVKAYNIFGKVLPEYKGFYVKNNTGDLSKFWNALHKEVNKEIRRIEKLCCQ